MSTPNIMKAMYIFWSWLLLIPFASAQDPCHPCANGEEASIASSICRNGVPLAQDLTAGDGECLALQLVLYQGFCCDFPPENYCTLCENGSQNYNQNKVIPRSASSAAMDITCQNVAEGAQFLLQGTIGICADTPRVRARNWCECEGAVQNCELLCDDGNPPPDLTKTDRLGQSCERYVFEYTTMTADECQDPVNFIGFDAKAFCCGEPAPNSCSICSQGKMLRDPDTEVQPEFFSAITCGELEVHASFLAEDACPSFLRNLLDDPFDAENACCVEVDNSGGLRVKNISTVFDGVAALIGVFVLAFFV